jgi:hypothetical protein
MLQTLDCPTRQRESKLSVQATCVGVEMVRNGSGRPAKVTRSGKVVGRLNSFVDVWIGLFYFFAVRMFVCLATFLRATSCGIVLDLSRISYRSIGTFPQRECEHKCLQAFGCRLFIN